MVFAFRIWQQQRVRHGSPPVVVAWRAKPIWENYPNRFQPGICQPKWPWNTDKTVKVIKNHKYSFLVDPGKLIHFFEIAVENLSIFGNWLGWVFQKTVCVMRHDSCLSQDPLSILDDSTLDEFSRNWSKCPGNWIQFLGNEAEYEDLKVHDYKKDLESRERKAREERNKEKHYKTSGR